MRAGGMLSAGIFMLMLGSFISIEALNQRYSYLRNISHRNSVRTDLISIVSDILLNNNVQDFIGPNPQDYDKYTTDKIMVQFSDLSSYINPHWISEKFLYKYCTSLFEKGMSVEEFLVYRSQIDPGLDLQKDYAGWFIQEAFESVFSPYSYPPSEAGHDNPHLNINTVNAEILVLLLSAHEETREKKYELAHKIGELQKNAAITLSELHTLLGINKQHELMELFTEHSNFWRLYVKKEEHHVQLILETVKEENSIRIAGFRFL